MTPRRGLLPVAVLSLGGCIYFNSLYNAQRVFQEAEGHRWAGREAEARALYDSVVIKAARSYRKEPTGPWADDALYVLGRAYVRRGDWKEAREALELAAELTDDEAIRYGALLYLGVVAGTTGAPARGIELLNEAIRGLPDEEIRGEGHLWRARLLLAAGRVDEGWWNLDRAAEAHSRYAVPAHLEGLLWGIVRNEPSRARGGVDRLLSRGEGHARSDTLLALIGVARSAWGPAPAAALLERGEQAPWPREERDRVLNLRSALYLEAGDTARAVAGAQRVAGGAGPEAARARRFLARLHLASVWDVRELDGVRAILLPGVGDAAVLELLVAVRMVELLASRAREGDAGPSLFAAAEMARDALEARQLARRLFLQYADDAEAPWRGKALLAALALTDEEADRTSLRLRLWDLPDDPYVATARGEAGAGEAFQRLEGDLALALDALLSEVSREAAELDILVRERSDTVG